MEDDNSECVGISSTNFRVDVSEIERVSKDQQDIELQSLEVSVFDQNTFEKSVIAQVDRALTQESDCFLKQEDESNLEEGELFDDSSIPQRSLEINVRTDLLPGPDISLNSSTSSSHETQFKLEDYLKAQARLHETRKVTSVKKPISDEGNVSNHISPSKAKPVQQKKKVKCLAPVVRKKKRKEKLGTRVKRGRWSGESCGDQPGEDNYFYNNTSGSDYVPSDDSVSSAEIEIPRIKPKCVSVKKRRRKRSSERADTDDSDWDSSEDEYSKQRGKKVLDDGHRDCYDKRIKEYTKQDCSEEIHWIEDDFCIPKYIWDKLYKYQQAAIKWFCELHLQNCGGILGDEMGLGKTIQVIAFLAGLHISDQRDVYCSYKGLGPTLIVCPTTVMHQWVREFHAWFPPFRVALLHDTGTYTGRDRTKLIDSIHAKPTYGILITSYTGLVQYSESILSKDWHYVILDEGHKIRNPKAKVTQRAKEIQTLHRLILSGSPLQNNLQEIWSLFDFVYPGKLGTYNVFMEAFAVPIVQGGYANASQTQVLTAHKCAMMLKDTITPYLLRRMKEDVGDLINLPSKKEQVLFCRLTEDQRQLYRHYLDTVDLEGMMRGRAKIFVGLINLRKICNHPDLYSGGPDRDFRMNSESGPSKPENFGYWKRAGKMIVIQTILAAWKDQGHRVLLFTQSKKMLLILEDFIKRNEYKYLKLEGGTSIASRQPLIDKFNKDSSYFIMLLTTKVGGLGINLTGANRVIIYDPDWNPATDTQARERAWRIGQQRDVTIYRLITTGTIEEKMYHRQIFKQFLSNKVLKDPRQRRFFKSNDLLELFTLSETVENGTNETAAIFAGTGSEVKIPKKISPEMKEALKKKPEEEKVIFSQSKIEQMKKLAQLLSQKIANKVKNETDNVNNDGNLRIEANSPVKSEIGTGIMEGKSSIESNLSNTESIYGPDGCLKPGAARGIVDGPSASDIKLRGEPSASPVKSESSPKKERREAGRKKMKKKERLASCEGIQVSHLVKRRRYKMSAAELDKEKHISQDDFILHKLLSKGLETALKHDTIMEGGPSDYAIVEAEAERVAQEAIKKLRQSAEVRRVTHLPTKKRPGEGEGLLSIIKKRNMLLDACTTDKDMLSSMITWLQSQGGTATTDQCVSEFRGRVGPDKSALFKALLGNIATFFRGPDRVGYWTLKGEYNTPTPSTSTS